MQRGRRISESARRLAVGRLENADISAQDTLLAIPVCSRENGSGDVAHKTHLRGSMTRDLISAERIIRDIRDVATDTMQPCLCTSCRLCVFAACCLLPLPLAFESLSRSRAQDKTS
jgi:hypothetical protein